LFIGDKTQLIRCSSGTSGGALKHDYSREEADSSLLVDSAVMMYSGARQFGGGAFVNVARQSITETLIHGCHAGLHGGGIYADDDTKIDSITDSIMSSNAAG